MLKILKGKQMSEIHGLQETIKGHRFWLGICVAIFISMAGWLVSNYKATPIFLQVCAGICQIALVIIISVLNVKIEKITKRLFDIQE